MICELASKYKKNTISSCQANERKREREKEEKREEEKREKGKREKREREPLCSSSENAIHESPLENYQQKIKKVSGKRRISPEVASNRGRDNTALPKVRGFSILGGSRRAEERREASVSRGTTARGARHFSPRKKSAKRSRRRRR